MLKSVTKNDLPNKIFTKKSTHILGLGGGCVKKNLLEVLQNVNKVSMDGGIVGDLYFLIFCTINIYN